MKVVILARKLLKINTRIFKMASTLTQAGYDVACVGLRSLELAAFERKDGYTITRVAPWHINEREKMLALELEGKEYRGGALWLYLARRYAYGSRWFANSLDYYRKAYPAARDLQPAIIHCNDADTLTVGVLLRKRLGCKLVYDMQEFYTGLHTMPSWYSWLMRREERFLSRYADAITVVNHEIRDHWEAVMGRPTSEVILNCPPFADVNGAGGIRAKLGVAGPLYVYSGGLAPRRGIEECIHALQHVEGTLVLLAEGERQPYQRLAEVVGVADRVKFCDFVPHTDVPEFIASADIGLLPYQDIGLNHHMCSPSKLFHYIMAEIPVVATDLPFLRRIVVGNGIGCVGDTTRPFDIATMIRSTMARRAEMRARLQVAKRELCWENEERKLLNVYQNL